MDIEQNEDGSYKISLSYEIRRTISQEATRWGVTDTMMLSYLLFIGFDTYFKDR